jgi:hypothetical protein
MANKLFTAILFVGTTCGCATVNTRAPPILTRYPAVFLVVILTDDSSLSSFRRLCADAEDGSDASDGADLLVLMAILGSSTTCGVSSGCTNHPTVCIDCDAGGVADGSSCVNEDNKCSCPLLGCTGDADTADDEAACSDVGGTWVAAGSAKTGCNPRESFSNALFMGNGTEAANLICATTSGEGTGAGQCEEPDANSGVTSCEWSTDTCIPTAATTTLFTDAWTESKATGMLAPFARGAAALAYDCSAGCTCSAADQATIEAADEGSETMPNVSDECMACLWQVHGNEEAQQQACALPPPPPPPPPPPTASLASTSGNQVFGLVIATWVVAAGIFTG